MKAITSLFILLTCCLFAQAQTLTITWRVVSANRTPIAQATVSLQGTGKSTTTTVDGYFSLGYSDKAAVLVVSHVGYISRTIPVSGQPAIEVVLQDDAASLDEVIVQGYGTTTRRYTTGSIGRVTAVEIEKQPVSNPLAALQGRVPGVVITQSSGVPGSEFKIEIRGRSSLDLSLSRNDPLYVIDNVPFEPGNVNTNQVISAASTPGNVTKGGLSPLNAINPSDIESIEILKDADATAIYGSRGANGVVLITTKKGKSGKLKLGVNLYSGISRVTNMVSMLNTQQYVQMRREGLANDGLTATAANSPDILLWDTTRYTNLNKLLIGRAAHTTSAQASLSGGNANTQFSLSGGYNRQTNVYSSDLSDQIRSARFNLAHTTLNRKLSLNFSGIYSSDKNTLTTSDLTQYINLPPHLKLYDSAGNLNWTEGGIDFYNLNLTNPLAVLRRKYASLNENLSANLNLNYQLITGLMLRLSSGYNTFTTTENSILPKSSFSPLQTQLPSADWAGSNSKSYIIEPQVEYRQMLGGGQLTLLAGGSYQLRSSSSYFISGRNYANDLLLGSMAGAGTLTASNQADQYRYAAVFGRINYDLKHTYILNLSGRRDASSRFGINKRFSNFGAVGAAWLFSNYNFVKQQLPFLSFGKLRGSYGITGNDQIGNYKYLDFWTAAFNPYQGVPGYYPGSLFNPDYTWEINKKLEGAVELGFLKDRIQLSAAWYRNRCGNLITSYRLPVQTGFETIGRNFPAVVQNTGIELLLSGKIIRNKQLEWSAAVNFTAPKNKLISFPALAVSSYASLYTEGESLTQIYAYDYLGVNPETGIYTFRDVDGDGQVTLAKDRILSGNLDPKFYGGFQNTIDYKGFQFSIFFEFRKQTGRSYLDQLNTTLPGRIGFNQPSIVLDRWRQKGDQAPVQRFTAITSSAAAAASLTQFNLSSGLYEDASFLRCKNLALSYALPAAVAKKIGMESTRFYVHVQNLFVLTKYRGFDPETQNFYILPPLRTIVGGVQFNF